MPEKESTPRPRVTVENLLELKRSEKPDQAFWERFDRELHQKSWQVLAKPAPWPVRFLKSFGSRLIPALPLTAAATFVVAMALDHSPSFFQGDSTVVTEYAFATPVSATPSVPMAGMAEDFAPQSGHETTFVVGQFENQSTQGSNVTLVAATRPMPANTSQHVRYVDGSMYTNSAVSGTPVGTSIY